MKDNTLEIFREYQSPYSLDQMFNLISDVENYSKFLPGIKNSRIESIVNPHAFIANLDIDYLFFKEKYQCIVHLLPPTRIDIEYLKGPFKSLESYWELNKLDFGIKIKFFISCSFYNSIFQNIMKNSYSLVTSLMIDAFEKRAKELYEKVKEE